MKVSIFSSITCLTELSRPIYAADLANNWFKGSDKRYLAQTLQKFTEYNRKNFDFLGVTSILRGTDKEISVQFRSDKYIGVTPVFSPISGKPMGDFWVTPRYSGREQAFSEFSDLIPIIGDLIRPEFNYNLETQSSINFSPPLYLEAIKFIKALADFLHVPWKKFNREFEESTSFKGNIQWRKFLERDFDPKNKFAIPTISNKLGENHTEFSNIKYVFLIACAAVNSEMTPIGVKLEVADYIFQLDARLKSINPKQTNHIPELRSDLLPLRNVKVLANTILENSKTNNRAWRIDYSIVFERVVQHIFEMVRRLHGGKVSSNPKIYSKSSNHEPWHLRYLEPDLIYSNENDQYFVDAKYKSHMFNRDSNSQNLKDDYRHDLHQLLAYSSFNKSLSRTSFLCYPASSFQKTKTVFTNPINLYQNTVYHLGIPLRRSALQEVYTQIGKIVSNND